MKKRKRNFSSFNVAEACKELGITQLSKWPLAVTPVASSKFYHERMRRLRQVFGMAMSQRAKALLIDAVVEEAMLKHPRLRVWKAAAIQSDELTGTVDYVVAPNRGYLEGPLLCVVEAKKDDFEQGLAQCLVEMKACQWNNAQIGPKADAYGVVTNGEGWKFYKLALSGKVFESSVFSLGAIAQLLGCLHFVFAECEKNLSRFAKAA